MPSFVGSLLSLDEHLLNAEAGSDRTDRALLLLAGLSLSNKQLSISVSKVFHPWCVCALPGWATSAVADSQCAHTRVSWPTLWERGLVLSEVVE